MVEFSELEHVTAKAKITYGFGNIGFTFVVAFFGYVSFFYTDKVGLSPFYIGIAFLLYGIWNAINDPFFGYLMDRTKSKHGKRIPWMRWASFGLGGSFLLLWLPFGMDQIVWFWFLLLSLMVYDTFFTIYIMAYMALLPQMTINPNERMKVQIVGFFVSLVPSIATLIIPLMLLEEASPKLVNPSPVPWQMAMLFIAIAIIVSCAIPAFFLRERPELHPPEEKPLGVLRAIITSLKSKSFVILLIFNFIAMWLGATVATIMIYYIDHYLELTGFLAFLPLAIPGLAGLLVLPLAYYLNRKFGSRNTVIVTGLVSLVGFIIIFFAEDFVVLLIAVGLAAVGISTYNLMFNLLFGDIVDEDELKTNQRREGIFYGINGVVSKPAESLGVAAVMFILILSGYAEGTGAPQSPSALLGIKIAASVLPSLLIIGMLVFLLLYPLHGTRFKRLKEQVNELHKEKKRQLAK